MDELLKKAAEIRGLPEMLVERSAKARAEETGQSVEEVLAEWVGEAAPEAADAGDDAADSTPAADEGDTAPPVTTGDAEDAIPAEITDDYLVSLAAKTKRMPEKLIRSSAEARARHAGVPLDVVLADWAGVDLNELRDQAGSAPQAPAASPAEPAPRPEPETPVETRDEPAAAAEPADEATEADAAASEPAAAPVAAVDVPSTDELAELAAAERGVPAALTRRSAQARAEESGQTLDQVLAEWAGVELPEAPAEPAPEAATEPEPEPVQAEVVEPEVSEEDAEDDEPSDSEVVVFEAPEADPDVDSHVVEEPVKAGRYPAWLAAAFLIIPLLAVTYILIAPNGPDCGVGGQLLIDPVSGEAVNCDGSAYGTVEVDHFANGAGIYAQCVACHAADGSGGAGPAFAGGELLSTFPEGSCSEQIEWITLGTAGWPDPTYGATDKPVGGGGLMPAFANALEPAQIAEVALYERVQFGGEDLGTAEADCGFDGEGNYTPADGSEEATG